MARGRTKRGKSKAPSKAKTKSKAKAKPRGNADLFRRALVALDRQARAREARVRAELKRLADIIRAAKADIAAIGPDEVKREFIATAAGELDAIVEATAEATNAIMDATETIEKVMGSLQGEAASALMTASGKIYEACGFQDITGQRIAKVVKAIKQIEGRIDVLNAMFSEKGGAARPATAKAAGKPSRGGAPKPVTDEDLLNGPQLKSKAKTQEEIDAMLFGSGR